jgi:hypothetical protein
VKENEWEVVAEVAGENDGIISEELGRTRNEFWCRVVLKAVWGILIETE